MLHGNFLSLDSEIAFFSLARTNFRNLSLDLNHANYCPNTISFCGAAFGFIDQRHTETSRE